MKDIKKFAKSLVVPVFIGMGVGVFVALVVGPAFDLDRFATGATTVILASILIIFVEVRKKKK